MPAEFEIGRGIISQYALRILDRYPIEVSNGNTAKENEWGYQCLETF